MVQMAIEGTHGSTGCASGSGGRRRRALTANGRWCSATKDAQSAKRGPQLDKGMELTGAFMSMIDMPTMSVSHRSVMSE